MLFRQEHQVRDLVQHGARQQASGSGVPRTRERVRWCRFGVFVFFGERFGSFLRYGSNGIAAGLQREQLRVVAGQVEGTV